MLGMKKMMALGHLVINGQLVLEWDLFLLSTNIKPTTNVVVSILLAKSHVEYVFAVGTGLGRPW